MCIRDSCWYNFSQEMTPALETSMKTLDLSMNDEHANDVYIVSVEDIDYEVEEE